MPVGVMHCCLWWWLKRRYKPEEPGDFFGWRGSHAHTHRHTHTGRQVTLAHCVWINGPPRGQGRGETAMGREIRGGLWCEGLCANGVGFDRGHRGPLSGTPHETPRGETALARGIMAHHGEGESRHPCRHLSVAEGSHCLLPQYATPSGHPRSTGVTPLQSPGDPTAHRGPGWIGAGDAAVESLLLPLLLLRRPPLPRRPVGGHPSEGDLRGCRGGTTVHGDGVCGRTGLADPAGVR